MPTPALKDKNGNAAQARRPQTAPASRATWRCPTPGAYRFYVALDKQNAEAELRFDHLPEPVFLSGTAASR